MEVFTIVHTPTVRKIADCVKGAIFMTEYFNIIILILCTMIYITEFLVWCNVSYIEWGLSTLTVSVTYVKIARARKCLESLGIACSFPRGKWDCNSWARDFFDKIRFKCLTCLKSEISKPNLGGLNGIVLFFFYVFWVAATEVKPWSLGFLEGMFWFNVCLSSVESLRPNDEGVTLCWLYLSCYRIKA